ncbi:ArnT family glycosyltransferase [Marinobacter zhejiangensis]|uniref:4-amino-4-deoxy-L-arabinose transferase n=1 Tax=Marinobacter zhejiangensis TaxID=488535 RepID=A0A1I4M7Z2_9GAMM|nr:glycosyltransferase family 39 protein [Marinobacter zhejiangensis]SFL99047.1 4-amino-4-deoxy-L-arabinose transferase [Marinobacter zhejiangensis]
MTTQTLSRSLYDSLQALPRQRLMLLLLAFAAAMIFAGIGLRSPWPADEPRFAEIAREMVDSGQWLIPMRGGEFYPDKPPVFMWTIAFFYWLTGNLKLAFLLPNALCGLLTLAAVYDLGCRLWNQRTGLTAAFLLLLAPQFLMQAKLAQIDAMVTCWITLGCYGLLRHFFAGPAWSWYFAAWGFMGLGIITKGVGFLPVLMLPPLLWLHWRDRERFPQSMRWPAALGPLIMLAVAAAWLVPMVLYVDAIHTPEALAYRDNILFKQTGERYANSWGHIQPWYYFLVNVIPGLWFPLPLLLLALLKPARDALRRQPEVLVLLVWVALVITFFSLSPGKRGVYVLPALPMLALAIAHIGTDRAPARWFAPLISTLQLLAAIALIAVGILAWTDHPKLASKVARYSQDPSALHAAGTFVLVIGLVWATALLALWRRGALLRLFIALMATWLLYSTWGYSLMEPLRTPRNVLAAAEASVPANATFGIIDFSEQFILFSRRDVTHFGFGASLQQDERNAWQWMGEGSNRFVLVADRHELECFLKEGAADLGVAHRERWLLMGPAQRAAHCPAPAQRQQFHTAAPGRWLPSGH